MSTLSFVKPNYPDEKRVSILPSDVSNINFDVYHTIYIESGFGDHLGIDDKEYQAVGCKVVTREQCFDCDYVFSLKLIQPSDYGLLKKRSKIIGWMHPNGSGKEFCQTIARGREIDIFDIDSVFPRVYFHNGKVEDIEGLKKHFFWKNSYYAGQASCIKALSFLTEDNIQKSNFCILGSGSVSQGAFQYLSSLGAEPRMFYRKTMDIFYDLIDCYDVIVNGIEIDRDGCHILSRDDLMKTKESVFIIDAAADAGRAIYGTKYLSMDNPVSTVEGRRYFLVNNAPTILHEKASIYISSVVSKDILSRCFF